jgi:hypothetical protein
MTTLCPLFFVAGFGSVVFMIFGSTRYFQPHFLHASSIPPLEKHAFVSCHVSLSSLPLLEDIPSIIYLIVETGTLNLLRFFRPFYFHSLFLQKGPTPPYIE